MASARILRERGTALLSENKHGEAIKQLTDALKLASNNDEKGPILLTRSRAFTGMADWLRRIPASESEAQAVMGLDPTTLATLALNDANKAAELDASNKDAYLQQGAAQMQLERYEEAVAAYIAGLGVDPTDGELQQGLQAAQQLLAGSRPSSPAPPSGKAAAKRRRLGSAEDAECLLCMKLLYEPVTTPCGHSFCGPCFMRAMDHSSKCPVCRTIMHVGRELPVTLVLRQLLQNSFPEEYEQRRKEEQGLSSAAGGEAPLPLFVMSCILPGERMRLNIFEPRYRLLVRRAMEGNRRFGMAMIARDGQLVETACEVEIVECQPVPDGRYMLEIEGKRRCRLQRSWEQDGYRVAQPEYFGDDPVEDGSPEADELLQATAAVAEKANALLERLRRTAAADLANRMPNLEVLELLQRASEAPQNTEQSPERLSFWVATMLPLTQRQSLAMLTTRSTLERLQLELEMLQGLRPSISGCTIC